MDYGPEDWRKRFEKPVLWMYSRYLGRGGESAHGDERVPTGNPFLDQFSRYFPDLRARAVGCGHFIQEEAPEYTNEVLVDFLAGKV